MPNVGLGVAGVEEARWSRGAHLSDVGMMEVSNEAVDMMIGLNRDGGLDDCEEVVEVVVEQEGERQVGSNVYIHSLGVMGDGYRAMPHGAAHSAGQEKVGMVKAHFVFVVRLALKATTCMGHLEDATKGFLEPVGGVSALD
jgi:hypothetical protein